MRPRWHRVLIWTSAILAAVAWLEFILFHELAREAWCWIVTALWPLLYGLIFAAGLALLTKHMRGSTKKQWLGLNLPALSALTFHLLYGATAVVLLTLLPLIAVLAGALMVFAVTFAMAWGPPEPLDQSRLSWAYLTLLAFVFVAPATFVFSRRRLIASGRRKRGECVSCGYDRSSLAANAKCPECGTVPS